MGVKDEGYERGLDVVTGDGKGATPEKCEWLLTPCVSETEEFIAPIPGMCLVSQPIDS
jgi:hypothetical protein